MKPSAAIGDITMVNSYGMPSSAPVDWEEDVAKAKRALRPGQMLIVSVVGTSAEGGTQKALADDFASCAEMAFEAGQMRSS